MTPDGKAATEVRGGLLLVNMAVGFAAGMAVHHLLQGKEHRHSRA